MITKFLLAIQCLKKEVTDGWIDRRRERRHERKRERERGSTSGLH